MPTQFFLLLRDWFRTRLVLQAEILALRHQLLVLQRAGRDHRLSLRWADRVLWVWLSQLWNDWPTALLIVKPRRSSPCIAKGFDSVGSGRVVAAMVDQAYIQKFGIYWAKEPGQPPLGAPRIHGELLKIGIEVSQATVAIYLVRYRNPPSQTWRTFLKNHAKDLVSVDFFIVPTVAFKLLFVFLILGHGRRIPIHYAVTPHPTTNQRSLTCLTNKRVAPFFYFAGKVTVFVASQAFSP